MRDGKWRTLDGTPLHHWTVAVSELHEAIFSDHLTRALGVGWERRTRGRDRNAAWEITGVPHELVTAFSQRSGDIDGREFFWTMWRRDSSASKEFLASPLAVAGPSRRCALASAVGLVAARP